MEQIDRMRAFAGAILAEGGGVIPLLELSTREQQALGGALFEEGPFFVEAVAEALADPRADFRHLPVEADALLARQEEASGWKLLALRLSALAAYATNNYLVEQSGAIEQARLVVRAVEEEAAEEAPDPAERWARQLRRHALGGALSILDDRRRRVERRTRQRLRQKAKPPRQRR